MEKQTFDPWAWGNNTNSVQAVEVKDAVEHFIAPDK
jgi:2-iminobutanoate/2-iminopropanoate deaminase